MIVVQILMILQTTQQVLICLSDPKQLLSQHINTPAPSQKKLNFVDAELNLLSEHNG